MSPRWGFKFAASLAAFAILFGGYTLTAAMGAEPATETPSHEQNRHVYWINPAQRSFEAAAALDVFAVLRLRVPGENSANPFGGPI